MFQNRCFLCLWWFKSLSSNWTLWQGLRIRSYFIILVWIFLPLWFVCSETQTLSLDAVPEVSITFPSEEHLVWSTHLLYDVLLEKVPGRHGWHSLSEVDVPKTTNSNINDDHIDNTIWHWDYLNKICFL